MELLRKTEKVAPLYRSLDFERAIDEEKREVTLSFSSELPVDRWFGREILDHSPDSIDMSRLNGGAAVLEDHASRQIGVVKKAWLDEAERKLYATLKFSRNQQGKEVFEDIKDEIRKNVSFGYRILKRVLEEEDEDSGTDTYRVTKWQPFEISVVGVPADPTVGVGRSASQAETNECEVMTRDAKDDSTKPKNEDKTMDEKDIQKMVEDTFEKLLDAKDDDETRDEIDPKAVVTEERNRAKEIRAIADNFGMGDKAEKAIENGMSVDGFREMVVDEMKVRQKDMAQKKADQNLGLSESEKRGFSFVRAINALANPTDKSAQERAKFELEISAAVAEKRKADPRGIFIPEEVLSQSVDTGKRDFNLTTGTGSNLRETTLMAGSFIEKLENAMVVMTLGPTVMRGLVGNVAIPKQTAGCTAYWIDPESENITGESNPTIGQVTMNPKTIGAYTDISRRLLIQSSIDVENFVRSDLALRLAIGIDLAALEGTGANEQPTGVLNASGIGSVEWASAATPSYSKVVELEKEVEVDNALLGRLAFVTEPNLKWKLRTIERATNTAQFIMNDTRELVGYPCAVTNQVTDYNLMFGNWADLLIGYWSGVDLTIDNITGALSGTVRPIVLQDLDIAVRHAQSFAVASNPSAS